ncbi:MAG: hypothetical protein AAF722_16610, partial [Cyanobacteria bacterium P01_C01_bin.70]
MAENNHHLNNGNSPFRRYEPPASTAAQSGKVSPLMPPPLSPPGGSAGTTSRSARRRQRHARSRWRQWIGTPPAARDAAARSPAERKPPERRSPSVSPRSQSEVSSRPEASGRIIDPLPRRAQPPKFSVSARAHQASPADQMAGRPSVRPGPAAASPQLRSGAPPPATNKVTPLRRQPVWTSPASPPNSRKPRRGKPRRPARRAPRPVLYGIRL